MRIMNRLNVLKGRSAYPPDACHFLHIGKAAGTQIMRLAEQSNGKVVVHKHDVPLRSLPAGAAYFFSIRDPISRFYSGFYSRKRQGRPTYYFPWSACEEVAFRDFEHADDLACSLFEAGPEGIRAAQAMISIRHTGQNMVSWFLTQGNLFEGRPPVWIIRQEHFDQDLDRFLRRANLEGTVSIKTGRAHANNYDETPPLSEKAKLNLRRWYAQDYEFYRVCEAWLDAQAN